MISIRRMQQRDLFRVVALEMENPSPWSLSLLKEELERAGAFIFVAEWQGEGVVGWLCARGIIPEAEVLKIAVCQRMRRQGVAKKLLSVLCHSLLQRGCRELFLEVRAGNISARKFYLKNGFVQIGQRALYYSEPDDDALVLKKNLIVENTISTVEKGDENDS